MQSCDARGSAFERIEPSVEWRLVVAAARGDPAARCELVDAFLPRIGTMARRYRGSPAVEWSELIQQGIVGLLRALQRYDPERGAPFWAYASWWVQQAMQEVVAELSRPMVLSDRALRQLARVKEAHRAHLQARGGEPSTADLAAAAGIPRGQVERLLAVDARPRALAEPFGSDDHGTGTLGDFLTDPTAEDDFQHVFRRAEMEEARRLPDELDPRERTVVRARFGLGCREHTLKEIAEMLGVTAERVRQIEQRALSKLRAAVERRDQPAG